MTTAGEIVGMTSEKELGIIDDIEKMVVPKLILKGLPLSSETIRDLEMDVVLCVLTLHLIIRKF